jgi:hypothetical protein
MRTEDFKRLTAEILDGRIGPEVEAIGWLLAGHFGLTDSIGGSEWKHRVAAGSVSPAAIAALVSVGVPADPSKESA